MHKECLQVLTDIYALEIFRGSMVSMWDDNFRATRHWRELSVCPVAEGILNVNYHGYSTHVLSLAGLPEAVIALSQTYEHGCSVTRPRRLDTLWGETDLHAVSSNVRALPPRGILSNRCCYAWSGFIFRSRLYWWLHRRPSTFGQAKLFTFAR